MISSKRLLAFALAGIHAFGFAESAQALSLTTKIPAIKPATTLTPLTAAPVSAVAQAVSAPAPVAASQPVSTVAITPALVGAMTQVLNTVQGTPVLNQLITADDGLNYNVSALDGSIRQIIPLVPYPYAVTASSSYSPALLPATPSRRMLDEEGLIGAVVKDQGFQGSCAAMAAVGALEATYKSKYGVSVDLAEQYILFQIPEHSIYSSLLSLKSFGIPTTPDQPFYDDLAALTALVDQVAPSTQGTNYNIYAYEPTAPQGVMGLNYTAYEANELTTRVIKFNNLIFPKTQAHEDTIYAPTDLYSFPAYALTDPTAYEQAIAQGYAVGFATDILLWTQTAVGQVFAPGGAGGEPHAMLLVGYDRDRQVFRFKNSWGSAWNGNGFGEVTYNAFLSTVTEAALVAAAKNPATGPIGIGVWNGFWRGTLNGQTGLAVVLNTFPKGSPDPLSGVAAQFYADNGTVTNIPSFLSGSATTGKFGDASGNLWLQMSRGLGSNLAKVSDKKTGNTSTWYRCDPNATSYNPYPTSYTQAEHDPYVLPPCDGAPWNAAPSATYSCNAGDILIQDATLTYSLLLPVLLSGHPTTVTAGSFCVTPAAQSPACADGSAPTVDLSNAADRCQPASGPVTPACPNTAFAVNGNPAMQSNCYLVPAQPGAIGWAGILEQPGPDVCMAAVTNAAVAYTCPPGSVAFNQGAACLIERAPSSTSTKTLTH